MRIAKFLVKIFIIAFALLRLCQSFRHMTLHYIAHHRLFSSTTALSFVVAICSLLLFLGAISEWTMLLEIWMVWTVLKFGAIIFAVFDLDFERDSFLSNAILVNVTLSSILQLITLILVLKMHKIISADEDEFLAESDAKKTNHRVLTIENQESEAVAFEPFLFSNLMLEH